MVYLRIDLCRGTIAHWIDGRDDIVIDEPSVVAALLHLKTSSVTVDNWVELPDRGYRDAWVPIGRFKCALCHETRALGADVMDRAFILRNDIHDCVHPEVYCHGCSNVLYEESPSSVFIDNIAADKMETVTATSIMVFKGWHNLVVERKARRESN